MDLNCGGEWILTKNNTAIIVYSWGYNMQFCNYQNIALLTYF
jgi:hypothetical protein